MRQDSEFSETFSKPRLAIGLVNRKSTEDDLADGTLFVTADYQSPRRYLVRHPPRHLLLWSSSKIGVLVEVRWPRPTIARLMQMTMRELRQVTLPFW